LDYPILGIARRSPLDQAASAMFAQLLEKHRLPARVQPYTDVATARSFKIDAPDAPLVCLSYFGAHLVATSLSQAVAICFKET
jgi:hypothetical protein